MGAVSHGGDNRFGRGLAWARARGLTFFANADIVSDLKTPTARGIHRNAAVLTPAARNGVVRVKRPDGRSYAIHPESAPQTMGPLPDMAARRRATFSKPISAAAARKLDRLIAGE